MKLRFLTILAAMVLALLPLGAFAQTAVNNSGFQVQNLGTATANITIVYYRADGSQAATQQDTIAANSSKTYFGSTMNVAAGFTGSVVISSDQPVVAITNLLGPALGDSYGGFSGGATSINLPLVLRGNFGVDTWISVQNAGTAAANVTVTYTAGSAGNNGVTDTATIAPGAAATFYQKNKSELGTRFVGAAKVASTNGQAIVAVVNQETQSSNALFSYGGFTTAGSTTVAAPLVVSNNFGSYTGIQILNTGTAAADATVTFNANTTSSAAGSAQPCGALTARTFNIPAGGSVTTIQGNGDASLGFDTQFASCRYIGSATVTSAQTIAVIVNQVSSSGSNGSAYAAVDPSATTQVINAPLIQANNFGTFSGVQVQNTGTAATQVTVTYGPNSPEASNGLPSGQSACPTPTARTQTLQPGASFTFIQSNAISGDPQFDSQFASCRYVGSATISAASGGKLTAIVNQVNPSGGDGLFTYSAFAQQ